MTTKIDTLAHVDLQAILNRCVHCGLCLSACATYSTLGTEMDAPRGRIALIRGLAQGRLDGAGETDTLRQHLDLCLTCGACETACPSGVHYHDLLEAGRDRLRSTRPPGRPERLLRWFALRQIMPHLGRLKLLARVLRLYQATGLDRLMRRLTFLPRPLRAMMAILPPLDIHYRDYRQPAPALGPRRGRVAFFVGCVQEAFLARVNEATIRVLQRNGYEVHFPAGQTCCGAAQLHLGEHDLARDLARRNIDALLSPDYEFVINNAGGCGATLRHEYAALFAGDPVYERRAAELAMKVVDISEFLAAGGLHVPPAGVVAGRATYSDSCHLRHVQHVAAQPRQLLAQVRGLEFVELAEADQCCGSAGVYNIVHADVAAAILDRKLANIAETGASLVLVSNTGCYMQLAAGVRQAGLPARVAHVVEVLDMAYAGDTVARA